MVAISLSNQKGGVGKTTVTLGFAESALRHGLRVLVVDCDPQANASAGLGIPAGSVDGNIADILADEIELDADNIDQFIFRSPWSDTSTNDGFIDLLGSHPRLSTVETHLAADPIGAFDRLDRALKNITNNYDVILFDSPPSLGLLTINALFASNKVVIVSAPSAWSSDGVETFTRNVDRIAQRNNNKPEVAGIVVNNVGRTRDGRYWESEITERYDYAITSIASRAAIAEAAAMSSPIMALGARAGAREACQNFDEVFLKLVGLTVEQPISASQIMGAISAPAKSIAAAV